MAAVRTEGKVPLRKFKFRGPPPLLRREGIFYFQNHLRDPRFHFNNENDFLHNQQCCKAWEYTDNGVGGGGGSQIKPFTAFPCPEG